MKIRDALDSSLGEALSDEVRVGTVDGVQGTEADLVVISTVRSKRDQQHRHRDTS